MIGNDFESLLKRAMGLDAASIGSSAVERAVRTRMTACSLADPQAYLDRLRNSAGEMQKLIEVVVVPETWFFRHREAFAAMVRIAREEWLQRHSEGLLRILSLPCSTGEEPYSIAMALLEAGFPINRFRVEAVDISNRALAHAGRAIYGKNSFRGSDLGFRDRYFTLTPAGYRLADAVSRHVRFQQGNLFDPDFLTGAELYDLIFCRNILIYFDSATQDRAVAVLTRLLSAMGALFVGPSEGNLLLEHGFVAVKAPLAFAFRRGAAPRVAEPVVPRQQSPRSTGPRVLTRRLPSPQRIPQQPGPSGSAKPSVEQIHTIADRGHLAEAARHCEELLRDSGPSPEALHLLGLIRDATGNREEAAACYRKALYLDPDHHEALAHLALLLERQGDKAGAGILNNRARRLDRQRSS
jgi:chemotaxis protein methyltransferase WspC